VLGLETILPRRLSVALACVSILILTDSLALPFITMAYPHVSGLAAYYIRLYGLSGKGEGENHLDCDYRLGD
jgi:hypothetical protein